MRVLVLGATGMLGHKLLQRLGSQFSIAGAARSGEPTRLARAALPGIVLYSDVVAKDLSTIERVIDDWHPEFVINCIGIVKQAPEAQQAIPSICVNALFPHHLHRLTAERRMRLIHFSTDCVFSGRNGPYKEDDIPDPCDLYGRSKLLGEVSGEMALTLRTSIIGPELCNHRGLLDWCLAQRGRRIKGYARALYSGLTTDAMAELVGEIIARNWALEGLWHVSSDPISKFDLLQIINREYGLGIELERDEAFVCDRRLDSTRFRNAVPWRPTPWREMIRRMRSEEENNAAELVANAR
jgi:dTDP-4-dehydrorhamnose reductase